MIVSTSSSSVKEPTNNSRRHSDLPPSYDAVEAERRGFLNGTREPPIPAPLEPPVPRGSPTSPSVPLTPNRMIRDLEPTPLYLDPVTGEPRATYMISDAIIAQCNLQGHVEKTRFGTLSILAAAVFFPWGLLCLMGSRVVYCDRCGLVLRGPRVGKVMRRGHPHKRGHT